MEQLPPEAYQSLTPIKLSIICIVKLIENNRYLEEIITKSEEEKRKHFYHSLFMNEEIITFIYEKEYLNNNF